MEASSPLMSPEGLDNISGPLGTSSSPSRHSTPSRGVATSSPSQQRSPRSGPISPSSSPSGGEEGQEKAKRKPDKSKIFRIRTNERESSPSFDNGRDYSSDYFEDPKRHATSTDKNSALNMCTTFYDDHSMDVSESSQINQSRGETPCLDTQEDEANNNNIRLDAASSASPARSIDDGDEREHLSPEKSIHRPQESFPGLLTQELSLNEQLLNSSMTLEAINNTRLTLARLASAAASGETSEKSKQDLLLLQRALYNLQHQQVIQMQLIKQLQEQLSFQNRTKDDEEEVCNVAVRKVPPKHVMLPPTLTPNSVEQPMASTFLSSLMDRLKSPKTSTEELKRETPTTTTTDFNDRPLSPGGSQSNITNSVIQHTDSPPASEPNTLEMLQRTANQVLSNASQGLLTNRLIDDYSKNSDNAEHKHRCRYCGKVFGSDSALQIHLRSHTGERPYKCNICGNRFTTKGNLKVHFQRHQSRFPHIKMNPHPIPEHLDKFYPPLLAQLGELTEPPPAPTGPPSPFPSLRPTPPLLRRPVEASPPPLDFSLGLPNPLLPPIPMPQEKPENLSWKENNVPHPRFMDNDGKFECVESKSQANDASEQDKEASVFAHIKDEDNSRDGNNSDRNSSLSPHEMDGKYQEQYGEKLMDVFQGASNIRSDMEVNDRRSPANSDRMEVDSSLSETSLPQKLDDKVRCTELKPNIPAFPFSGMRFPFPFNLPFLPGLSPPLFQNAIPPPQPRQLPIPTGIDPSKDPTIYNSLLPRPGSTDNSWEALIEVKKTSETAKLEELVKNVDYKLEPNQCVICHRILSCKSALQMHYRTHTGERPFKCKICNHTFTTKGNLKTHMSVHRARPHVGMLHQCPVCHKKFGNALVLQQHIRLHTGETTDLSPEQIAAAEVKEISNNFHSFPPNVFPPGLPLPPHHPLAGFPPFGLPVRYPIPPDLLRNHEKMEDDAEGKDEPNLKPKSDDKSPDIEQKVAEDLSIRGREESLNGSTSPRKSISPSPSDYSDPGIKDVQSDNSSSFLSDRGLGARPTSPSIISNNEESSKPLNLISRPPHTPFWSPFGLFPQPLASNALNPVSSALPPVFSPLYIGNIPGRGNTTCRICFKTLACQSALEIHYRSHTKERPFKCLHCDRGFTTKGNMKQHLLTHKIRSSDKSSCQDNDSQDSQSSSTAPVTSEGNTSTTLNNPVTTFSSFLASSLISSTSSSPTSLSDSSRQREVLNPPTPLFQPHTPPMSSPTGTLPLFPTMTTSEKHLPAAFQTHEPVRLSRPFLNSPHDFVLTSPASTIRMLPDHDPRNALKNDPLNLKRERDGELQLPLSKRAQGCEEMRPLNLHQKRPDTEVEDKLVARGDHQQAGGQPLQVL